MRQATCRSCGAAIVWMTTAAGRNIPIDADSIDEAEVEHDEQRRPLFDPKAGHVAHFATCPHAELHRRT